jgi:hypothetical protein
MNRAAKPPSPPKPLRHGTVSVPWEIERVWSITGRYKPELASCYLNGQHVQTVTRKQANAWADALGRTP